MASHLFGRIGYNSLGIGVSEMSNVTIQIEVTPEQFKTLEFLAAEENLPVDSFVEKMVRDEADKTVIDISAPLILLVLLVGVGFVFVQTGFFGVFR